MEVPHHVPLVSGALAGLSVDLTLFPLDTLKTRLQSGSGFVKAGGFSRLWSGLGPVAVGSAPGSAVFFLVYESSKSHASFGSVNQVLVHMMSASLGEIGACVVRVPVEVIKQRMQVAPKGSGSAKLFKATLQKEGLSGLFRGYSTTVLREVPFSCIQFPLWEWLKLKVASSKPEGKKGTTPLESAACGALAGGFSAGLTTPLDVAKTRIMLAKHSSELARRQSAILAMKIVYSERGFRGLFSGVVPRLAWISIGGALYLGIYDLSVSIFRQ